MNSFKLNIAFGSDLVKSIEQYDQENLENNALNNGGVILEKEFNTEAEKNAYIQGLHDMEGWYDYSLINSNEVEKFKKLI